MAGKFPEVEWNPTRVSGARTLGASIVSTRIKPQVADEIFSYQPNGNAVALITSKMRRKREVGSYQFFMLHKDRNNIVTTVNYAAGYDADDASIVVADGAVGYGRAVFMNERTMERFMIASGGVSGTTWTIGKRGLGSTAQPMLHDDRLVLISDAYPENANVGTARSIVETAPSNYVQTHRTPFAFSRRDMDGELFGGSDVTTEEAWQMSEHAQKIERAFLWGAPDAWTDGVDGTPNSTSGGLHYFLSDANEFHINGIPWNERNFIEYTEEAGKYGRGGQRGTKTKWFICAPRYATEFASWGLDKLRVVPKTEMLGMDVSVYQTPHLKVFILVHPLFEGPHADKAFLLDFNHLRYVYFRNGDTKLLRNRGGNGVDGKTHEWLSDVSIEITLPLAHGYVHGLPL